MGGWGVGPGVGGPGHGGAGPGGAALGWRAMVAAGAFLQPERVYIVRVKDVLGTAREMLSREINRGGGDDSDGESSAKTDERENQS